MNLITGIADQSAQVSVAMNPAMKSLGVCTPIELNTYMNDVDAGPFMPGGPLSSSLAAKGLEFVEFQMTVAQASAFLAMFTKAEATEIGQSSSYIAVLGSLVQTFLAGDSNSEAQMNGLFSPTFGTLRVKSLKNPNSVIDLPPSAIISIAYASYLTTYLPESFFVGALATPRSQPQALSLTLTPFPNPNPNPNPDSTTPTLTPSPSTAVSDTSSTLTLTLTFIQAAAWWAAVLCVPTVRCYFKSTCTHMIYSSLPHAVRTTSRYGDDKLGPLHAPNDWWRLERVGRPTHIRGEYTDVAPRRLPPGCLLWDAWPVS